MPITNKLKEKLDFYVVTILLISLSLAWMHLNIVMFLPPDGCTGMYQTQILLAQGLTKNPDAQVRLLYPNIVRAIGAIIPDKWPITHKPSSFLAMSHPVLAFAGAEWISIFFCLLGMFLLSNEIFGSRLRAFLATVGYSIFLPYIFNLPHRWGEAFIPGFFCFLAYCVLARKNPLFLVMLILCAFQRPDIAAVSVLLKIIYDYKQFKKKYLMLLYNLALIIVPIFINYTLVTYLKLDTYGLYTSYGLKYVKGNTITIPFLILYFFPVLITAAVRFKNFDKKVYYLLFSLLPYLAVTYVIGGYSETRILHPLVAALIIGVFSSIDTQTIAAFVAADKQRL